MFEEHIVSRLVTGTYGTQDVEKDLTAFLGLYNAEAYLESLLEQILSQTVELKWLVVDNDSEDSTWETIQSWRQLLPGRIKLVRNKINLGGTGTLLANLDLVDTEWVATLHQDDFYKSNHLETLLSAIHQVDTATLAIASDMGTLTTAGIPGSTPPRASWLMPDSSRATLFLANLRLHSFPFPAAAFRVTALNRYMSPWHSTTFPDSELVLKWILNGKIKHIHAETMLYRENLKSESHTVNYNERNLGNYLALSRILGVEQFTALAASIENKDRSRFFQALVQGLKLRIVEPRLQNLIIIQAAEICAFAWEYSEVNSNQFISDSAYSVGGVRTAELIDKLSEFHGFRLVTPGTTTPHEGPEKENRNKTKIRKILFDFALKLYGNFPYVLRRELAKRIMKPLIRFRDRSPWNSNWRK